MPGPSASDGDLLVYNLSEVATLAGGVRRGEGMRDLGLVKDAAVVIRDGHVESVGDSETLKRKHRGEMPSVNAGGRAASPGLVDAHTHAVFAGDRVHEFDLKLSGVSYGEILKAGGGILHTVRATREATRAELLKQLLGRLDRMIDHGTTCAEIKSGYGLDKDTEIRLLETIHAAAERHPMDLVSTFLGAHAVPPEFKTAAEFAEFLVTEVLPDAADRAEFVDVFCEHGAFDVASSRRVLEAGRELGLKLKVHADELAHSGGSRLASEMGALSADHLLHADDADVAALVKSGTIPVLLPATAFSLGAPYAPARRMIDAGAPVAVATDLNPNCWCESLPLAMALACHGMRMTPAEAFAATTINAAAALGRDRERGSLEPGKVGDLVVWDAPTLAHVPYRFGVNLAWKVVKYGEIVVDRSERRI